jgi:hypothetical protein
MVKKSGEWREREERRKREKPCHQEREKIRENGIFLG